MYYIYYVSYSYTEPDDYGFSPGQPRMDNMSNILRRQPKATASSSSYATATSAAEQPPFSFQAAAPPSATQGMPVMPFSQVTMSHSVSGTPATFTNLNTMNPTLQHSQQIKSEQAAGADQAQSLLNEAPDDGSACNSLNFDSGLLNFVNDTFPIDSMEQSDSLTKFLTGHDIDSNAGGAGSLQQDVLMSADLQAMQNSDIQDIHQKLTELNQ